jgi:putative ABC transport system substrate-binding protein
MRRRDFITLLGSSAAALPLAARAQQPDRMRRIGVLMNVAAEDPGGQSELAAFQRALDQLGCSESRNVQLDIRWGENDVDRDRRYATELIGLSPDVILASGTLSVAALQRQTQTIRIPLVLASSITWLDRAAMLPAL